MKVSDKRGVSGVVTAVLLILLVIAAIGILWVVIQNFVERGTSGIGGSAECLETNFEALSGSTISDEVVVRRTAGTAVLASVTAAVGEVSGSTTGNVDVGGSIVVSITNLPTGNQEVSVAVELDDGTSCPLISAGSITIA